MKKCKFCAEEIQDDAKKCRFCGEWIEGESQNIVPQKRLEVTKEEVTEKAFSFWRTFAYSTSFLAIIFSLFIYFVEGFDDDYVEMLLAILLFSGLIGILLTYLIRELNTSSKLSGEDRVKYNGLEGWLVFLALGLLLGLIIDFGQVLYEFYLLWNERSEYDIFGILITGSLLLAFLLFHVYVVYLFFSKKKSFPKWGITLLILTAIINIVGLVYTDVNDPERQSISSDTGRSMLAAMIWVPYILKSKRVKATFVKK